MRPSRFLTRSLQVLEYLCEIGVDPAYRDSLKQTALFYSAKDGKIATCQFFLNKGLALNEPDNYGQTPIFYAARYLYNQRRARRGAQPLPRVWGRR